HNVAVKNLRRVTEADLADLALGLFNQVVIGTVPEGIALEAEILHAEAGGGWVRHHLRAPVLEVLNTADGNGRVMDVNPIIGEHLLFAEHKRNDEEVAIAEAFGSFQD